MTTEALLSTTRAAERLGYTPARLRALVREGRGPTPVVRGTPGRAGFYAVEELDRWALTHRKWEKLPPVGLPEDWTVFCRDDGTFSAECKPIGFSHSTRRDTYEKAVADAVSSAKALAAEGPEIDIDIAEMYYAGAEDDADFCP